MFLGKAELAGIAGVIASKTAPAFAQQAGMVKIGQLGLGSHGFLGSFLNPPADWKGKVKCRPYIVWDDEPGVADVLKKSIGFERVAADPEELVRECDAVHVEHADYRRVLELARPALEAGKPVFINRPCEAILEQHRALVAANVSRLTGRAVRLDSLGGDDALPYSTAIRNWLFRYYKVKK